MPVSPLHPGSVALAAAQALAEAAAGRRSLSDLRALLEQASEDLLSLHEAAQFDRDRYTRKTLVQTQDVSVLLLAWLPGQTSEIHDHGGSLCTLRVLRGVATESRFELDANGLAVEVSREAYLPGAVLGCDGTDIHAMGNDGAASDPLVTLHVYTPAPVMRLHTPAKGARR
jgi:cysteine dioxygenase